MAIKQSHKSGERPGHPHGHQRASGLEGINIRAISVAEADKASAVRFVTDNPAKTSMSCAAWLRP